MEDNVLTNAELDGQSLDTLEDIFVEQESAFETKPAEEGEKENENSAESSTETNENGKEPSQEGEPEKDNTSVEENIPFHKHPRFKEIIEENKKLKDEIEQVRTEFSQKLESIKNEPTTEQIPESFKKLYGDSPEIWAAWNEYLSEEKAKIKEEVFANIRAEAEKKEKEVMLLKQKEKEAQQYFENQFAEIESQDGKIDRNAIIKVLDQYHCVDPETNLYDIKAAYDIYKKINRADSEKSNKRKEIADTTTSKGNSTSEGKPVAWDSIRNKGWGVY